MKDYKAECDKLRGELTELRRQYEREIDWRMAREAREREVKDRFKELLLDVLGR
jgi:hypothetical protein